ncbi:MAG: nucleoside-triphosphatase [Elusimicrobiota bacterium]
MSKNILWRKAAVLGGIWAASEIVLGSFLHNARVPFSGEVLTAIGIAILVAGHRLWPERGLLWRAGLVCAAMKSVSPSAVIFGPMLAISMEGLLAEAGVRLLGCNPAGYLLAGGLAMCWALAHKVVSLLIFYGPDTVAVYLRGVEWMSLHGGFGPGNLWAPLIFLFAAYFLAGAAAAVAGMCAENKTASAPAPAAERPENKFYGGTENVPRAYSAPALILHILFITAVMSAGRKIPPTVMLAAAGVYSGVCARYYLRATSLLKHYGVWGGVLAASLTAGLMLGSLSAGFYMALRAFILTFGFAAIGCELTNPSIRRLLERLIGGIFFETLEYAFNALPGIIAGLPPGRDFVRRPLSVLGEAVARAPFLLETLGRPPVFIITGAHGSGKSELVMKLAELLRAGCKKPGGICAVGLWENGLRSGFDVVDLFSGARVKLCRREAGGSIRAGEFRFSEEGVASGLAALSGGAISQADVVFVDEVGFLELDGGGWAAPLRELSCGRKPRVLVVRDYLVERVVAYFSLDRPVIWEVGNMTATAAMAELLAAIEASKKSDF